MQIINKWIPIDEEKKIFAAKILWLCPKCTRTQWDYFIPVRDCKCWSRDLTLIEKCRVNFWHLIKKIFGR